MILFSTIFSPEVFATGGVDFCKALPEDTKQCGKAPSSDCFDISQCEFGGTCLLCLNVYTGACSNFPWTETLCNNAPTETPQPVINTPLPTTQPAQPTTSEGGNAGCGEDMTTIGSGLQINALKCITPAPKQSVQGVKTSFKFFPKIEVIRLNIKKAPATTTSPTIEYNNFFFAEEILPGSPEDVIHSIPPISIKITARSTAAIKNKFNPVCKIFFPLSCNVP